MRLSEFNYELPEELIAQVPLADRASSRLLVLHKDTGAIEHRAFRDVVDYLANGDLLVTNDTRVSALRVLGQKATGGKVELLLLEDEGDGSYIALAKPAKKLRPNETVVLEGGLQAHIDEDLGEGKKRVSIPGHDRLRDVGRVPLPPYITAELADPERYQTVYATHAGSAAAPTAGLHFTQEVLDDLERRGVKTASVTLDVSIDTFRPIQVEDVERHQMHGERCALPPATAEAINSCKGRVVAVGTTSVRTIESFATVDGNVEPGTHTTKLFIRPGYDLRAVDAMFTNFHLPGTSMLFLVAALAGTEPLKEAYRQAVKERYRFLSFGDSMLVI